MNIINAIKRLEEELPYAPTDATGYHLNNCRFVKKTGNTHYYYYLPSKSWRMYPAPVTAVILPLYYDQIKFLIDSTNILPTDQAKLIFIQNEIEKIQFQEPLILD